MRQWPIVILFKCVLLSLCCVSSLANSVTFTLPVGDEVIDLKSNFMKYSAGGYSDVNRLVQDEVLFTPFTAELPKLNVPEHWIKLEFKNNSEQSSLWYLNLGYPTMPLMHAFWESEGRVEEISLLDSHSSYFDRSVNEPILFIPLEFSGKEIKTLYVNYRILGNAPISLKLYSTKGFKDYQFREHSINHIIMGFMLAIFILVIVFLVIYRSVLYFYFASLIFLMTFSISDMVGYNHRYFWPESGLLAEKYIEFILIATHICYLCYIQELLQFKQNSKNMYRLYSGIIYFSILMAFLAFFYSMFEAFVLLGVVTTPVYIYTSIWVLRKKQVSSLLFSISLISHVTLVFGLFLFSMLFVNPFPEINFMSYVCIGFVLEAVFFVIALSNRSYVINKNYQEALLKRAEEADKLLETVKENNELLRSKQDQFLKFTGTVHDIFQPLSSVRMALGSMPEDSGHNIKSYIDDTVDYAETLLKSFMLESNSEFKKEGDKFIVGELFSNIVARHHLMAEDKNIKIKYFNSARLCTAYKFSLQRILDNLVANAIRYSSKGKVYLGVRLKQAGIELQVSDSGRGMSEVEINKILTPFTQGEFDVSQNVGYGMGLYIVKKLCEQSGFELAICSEVNKGSCFKVLISHEHFRH